MAHWFRSHRGQGAPNRLSPFTSGEEKEKKNKMGSQAFWTFAQYRVQVGAMGKSDFFAKFQIYRRQSRPRVPNRHSARRGAILWPSPSNRAAGSRPMHQHVEGSTLNDGRICVCHHLGSWMFVLAAITALSPLAAHDRQ